MPQVPLSPDAQKILILLAYHGYLTRLSRQLGNETVGENIKKVRNKLGLTQDDLVRKSGVKHATLTKIEGNFVQKPSVQVIAKIARSWAFPLRI